MIVHIRDGLCVLRLYLDFGIDHRYNFKYFALSAKHNNSLLDFSQHFCICYIFRKENPQMMP